MLISPVLSLSPTLEKRVYSARIFNCLVGFQAKPTPANGSTEFADCEAVPAPAEPAFCDSETVASKVTFEKKMPARAYTSHCGVSGRAPITETVGPFALPSRSAKA